MEGILKSERDPMATRYQTVKLEAESEVENKEMRPEFEVLKPYFSKYLKTKNVKVNLVCKLEKSQLKSFEHLDKILEHRVRLQIMSVLITNNLFDFINLYESELQIQSVFTKPDFKSL